MKELEFLHKDFFSPKKYKQMVKSYQEKDDPTGWFDKVYESAQGDYTKVFWADLEPSAYLIKWLKQNHIKKANKKACVIGCGVGDDAQALSDFGFDVIAFDISKKAIDLCKNRYPNSKVDFTVANLFDFPKDWFENFDVVYECNTIQVLLGEYRKEAKKAMCSLIAKDGYILVSCRSAKEEDEKKDEIPKPLLKSEIDEFKTTYKLKEKSFLAYDDNQTPSIPHFFAVYQK